MGIQEAFEKMKQRIKPAVLVSEGAAGNQNGVILHSYCQQNGINLATATDEELASVLYDAVTAKAEKLAWIVKPAKLTKFAENEKGRNQTTAKHEQDAFVEKARKSEANVEYEKKQAASKKQLDQMIENVLFVDGFKGQIIHGKTDSLKQTLRNHVEKAVKAKRDLTVVVKEVENHIAKQYEAAERAVERV